MTAPPPTRRAWLAPWPDLAPRLCDCHLAPPSRAWLVVRRWLRGTPYARAVVYDARTLAVEPTCGQAAPCQVLAPAAVPGWALRVIDAVERAFRLLGRPVAVVLYAETPARPPAGPSPTLG